MTKKIADLAIQIEGMVSEAGTTLKGNIRISEEHAKSGSAGDRTILEFLDSLTEGLGPALDSMVKAKSGHKKLAISTLKITQTYGQKIKRTTEDDGARLFLSSAFDGHLENMTTILERIKLADAATKKDLTDLAELRTKWAKTKDRMEKESKQSVKDAKQNFKNQLVDQLKAAKSLQAVPDPDLYKLLKAFAVLEPVKQKVIAQKVLTLLNKHEQNFIRWFSEPGTKGIDGFLENFQDSVAAIRRMINSIPA